jgi:hypothetical protein
MTKPEKPSGGAAAGTDQRFLEDEGVFSGRLVIAATLGVAMVVIPVSPLGKLITKEAPKTASRTSWKVGDNPELHLTVVTADFKKLGCADERVAPGGAHCEFKSDRVPFPNQPGSPQDDNKKNILQPYRTTDQALVYLSGFWAQPEIATRLHDEPAAGVPETKLARFLVTCRVKFTAEWNNPKLRWGPSEKFSSPTTQEGQPETVAMVGEPSNCRIMYDERH